MVIHRRLSALALFFLFSFISDASCFAQVAPAAESRPKASVVVDGGTVEHLWMNNPTLVFGKNGHGRWRYFMHGLTDEKAKPFAWDSFLSADQEEFLDGERVSTTIKRSELYSLALPGGTDMVVARPILSLTDLAGKNGQVLRLHMWIRGTGTGKGGNLWTSAPQASLILRDSMGNERSRAEGQFRTRGTFPWFCYYLDLKIPSDFITTGEFGVLGGVFVRLSNPVSGRALFCTPSYEFLVPPVDNQLPLSYADPKRGTFAPNPDYDELPMNFLFGLPQGEGIRWSFLEGNMQEHSMIFSYDVAAYLHKYKNDWFHMTQAAPYLLYFYTVAMKDKKCSALQPGWDIRFIEVLKGLQDPKTGMWKLDGRGNLLLTQLLVSQCFSPVRQARFGETSLKTDWCAVRGEKIPHMDTMVRSVLREQMRDENGVLGGWNKYAFQGKDLKDASRDVRMFDLRYSAAAVRLLTYAYSEVGSTLQQEIQKAVEAAYRYAVNHVMGDTWLFCEDERQQKLLLSPYGFLFLEGTQALDTKMEMGTRLHLDVDVDIDRNQRCTLGFHKVPAEAVSLRIYGIPEGKTLKQASNGDLLAIVRLGAERPSHADPLLLAERFCDAQVKPGIRTPITIRQSGALYVEWCLDLLKKQIRIGSCGPDNKAVLMLPVSCKGQRIGLVVSDAYGNLSILREVDVP